MKSILNAILVSLLALTLTSCGADAKKELQEAVNGLFTESTPDVHGIYMIASDEGSPETSMQIINEGGYFTNNKKERERDYSKIFALIERNDFTQAEKNIFSKYNINLASVEKLKTRFYFGASTNAVETYEIDKDKKESRILIRSSGIEIVRVGDKTIEYIVDGAINRDTLKFKGNLQVVICHYLNDNGQTVLREERAIISLNN